VLVIGGGPAGMEAARIAALRGHRVTLAEASDALGGMLRIARRAPLHESIGDIADWLARETARLGVEVKLGVRVDAAFVRELAPDAAIVATGALPAPSEIPGAGLRHVVSTAQLLGGGPYEGMGPAAFVYDEVGAYEAIGAAEFLVAHGVAVTFATPHPCFAPLMESALVARPARERLEASGRFTLRTRTKLRAIEKDRCVVSSSREEDASEAIAANGVVAVLAKRPNRALAAEIEALGFPVEVVGDASAAGLLPGAIAQGHRAGREI
jgi:pyruvate/2-oxoglutarate dehydrogenase complex dihydrolipoamide dehydrogenase (E3) component